MTQSRSILRAMSITGGTQAISIVLSVVRMKALALLLGPAGVGVLGIFNSFVSTSSTLAGGGISNAAVRQLAQSRNDVARFGALKRVIFIANAVQGLTAMVIIWLLRDKLSVWLFGKGTYSLELGIAGIAMVLTLMLASQTALLRGLRRIGDIGRVTVLGAITQTVVGLLAVYILGMDGLLCFVIAQPLTAVLVAMRYTKKIKKGPVVQAEQRAFWPHWIEMARIGFGFMLGGLATTGTMLIVNARIANELGLGSVGQFVAAWGLTATYLGFLLNAMSMDYYPRLAEIIEKDRGEAIRLMNEQAQLSLLIGGPIIFAMIGFAPLVITILYSADFTAAVTLLQWQVVANIFKVATWPISMTFPATGRARTFLISQIIFNVAYLSLTWFGMPYFGLEIAGIAFLVGYFIYFVLVNLMVRKAVQFRWERLSVVLLAAYVAIGAVVLVVAFWNPLAGMVTAGLVCSVTGFFGGHILLERLGPSRYTAPLVKLYGALRWPIVWK